MIRLIEGIVASANSQAVTVMVHGVGYLVHIPTDRYQIATGDQINLHTHLAVKENALDLYGFMDEKELTCFELLLLVPKIGPKSALQVLSLADPDIIATAVVLGDAEHLHKVSGIGKKTATNIVTALAGKIDASMAKPDTLTTPKNTATLNSAQKDAIDALVTLGYDAKEAQLHVLKLEPNLEAKALIQAVLTTKTPL